VRRFARQGGQAVILRPGCVGGPGSALWVGRIAGWLRSGRLGDLGAAGDGWSNLAHVDDVCCALRQALSLPLRAGELPTFNLAAPDSPRWNDYFMDLALALRATPVARLSARRLWLDSHLLSPPLQAAQRLGQRLGLASRAWPQALPPGLARLWSQQIRLDSSAATAALSLRWTPYARLLDASVRWLLHSGPGAPARSDLEAKLRP
jgi:nucleoside-diphosphate-sugar epimerase